MGLDLRGNGKKALDLGGDGKKILTNLRTEAAARRVSWGKNPRKLPHG